MSTPNEDGCCSACWLPYEMCECGHWNRSHRIRLYPDDGTLPEGWDDPPYDNGDRAEDVEAGLVHGDGGERTYLNDNDGDE